MLGIFTVFGFIFGQPAEDNADGCCGSWIVVTNPYAAVMVPVHLVRFSRNVPLEHQYHAYRESASDTSGEVRGCLIESGDFDFDCAVVFHNHLAFVLLRCLCFRRTSTFCPEMRLKTPTKHMAGV